MNVAPERHTKNAVKADQKMTESRWDIAINSTATVEISSEIVLLSRYIIRTLLTEPIPPAELL